MAACREIPLMRKLIKDTAYGTTVYLDYLWLRVCVHPCVRSKARQRPMRASANYFPDLRCAFIHIPKAAGTTVNYQLRRWSDQVGGSASTPRNAELTCNLGQLSKHIKATTFRSVVGPDEWNELFTFTFVRNPWELMVSSYFWWRQISYQGRSGIMDSALIRRMSFPEFINSRYGRFFINEHHGTMSDWFTDQGESIVKHVGRVENLHEELQYISAYIGGVLSVELKDPGYFQLHKTDRQSYQKYYDDESKDIVYRRFSDVIEHSGYRFSGIE